MANDMKKKDEGCPPGYVSRGIPVPTRVKKESANRKRWQEFADEVAGAFNEMRETDCQSIAPMVFEDGVLITGFRPPTPIPVEAPAGMGPGIGMQVVPLGSAPSALRDAAMGALMSQVLDSIKENLASAASEEEAVKKAVEDRFKQAPAEALRTFIEFVERHREACDEEECGARLPLVIKEAKARLDLQLS